jgi:hypothetical protein
MKIEIDPLKIPAFQRKSKITFNKNASFRMDKDPEIKILDRLKKENQASMPKNRVVSIERPVSYEPKQASLPISAGFSWRKMDRIGEVEQYFAKIDVIAFKLEKPLRVGERIIIESPKGLFEQEVSSMQINRQDIVAAKKGEDIGIKVQFEPSLGGSIYKIVAEG